MTTSLAPAKAARVLVIEQNAEFAHALARFLRATGGYDVAVARDGPGGLAAAVADPPDAVVCEIALPRRNGLLVGEEIVEMVHPRPVLVAVTAQAGATVRALAADAGFDHFLVKPVSPRVIEVVIAAHLADHRSSCW
jgi:DNA-binding response OmpR family regulator